MSAALTQEQRDWLRREIDRKARERRSVTSPEVGSLPDTQEGGCGAPGERRCFSCGRWKPLDEFCKSKRHTGGRSYQCRRCKASYAKAREKEIRAAGGEPHERLKRRMTEAARRRRARQKEAKA